MKLSKCSEARTFEFGFEFELDIKLETNFFCDWLIVNLVVYVFAKKISLSEDPNAKSEVFMSRTP